MIDRWVPVDYGTAIRQRKCNTVRAILVQSPQSCYHDKSHHQQHRARKDDERDEKRKEILRSVRRAWSSSTNVLSDHPEHQDDDEVVEAAVRNDPKALQFASVRLRNDRALASLAAEINVQSLQYVSDALKDDKAFYQALLAKEFTARPHVTKEILAHMSSRLKNDKEIVLGEIEERIATVFSGQRNA